MDQLGTQYAKMITNNASSEVAYLIKQTGISNITSNLTNDLIESVSMDFSLRIHDTFQLRLGSTFKDLISKARAGLRTDVLNNYQPYLFKIVATWKLQNNQAKAPVSKMNDLYYSAIDWNKEDVSILQI